jgi:hypothetical protein
MQGATLSRENFAEQRGSSLDRVEVNSMITPIRSKEDTRTVSTAETAIKRSLVTVNEDSGTTAANRNRWRQ